MSGAVRIGWGGQEIELRPERAALLVRHGILLVADLHLGKARAFRREGVPVPAGTTRASLQRLEGLVQATGARRIVFLGDLLHSHHAQGSAALEAFARWRQARPELELTLVRGNHDARAGDPPAALGVGLADEPLCVAGLALCHHPDPARRSPGGFDPREAPAPDEPARIAGHAHPCLSLHRGCDRLRLPCFHFGPRVAVLPAFGDFTGMHAVRRAAGDRLWVIADGAVVPVAAA